MSPLRRFIHAWRFATTRPDPAASLHTIDRMQSLLARERMRSDRGNSQFALLTFTSASSFDPHELSTLTQVFAARIRATDDAGLLSSDRVGVILPETPADGAWKLASDLLERLPEESRDLDCEVFTYPTDDSNGRHEDEELVVHPAAADLPLHTTVSSGVVAHSIGRRVRPMHTFFLQPLPRWKRVLDLVISSLALFALSPLLLAVAAAIKSTSSGPVIFRQRRDTIGGRQFTIYKFRTMAVDAEQQKAALRPSVSRMVRRSKSRRTRGLLV